jgi:hypothetical protein
VSHRAPLVHHHSVVALHPSVTVVAPSTHGREQERNTGPGKDETQQISNINKKPKKPNKMIDLMKKKTNKNKQTNTQ